MNKQEALKQIEEQRDMILELHGWGVFGYIKGIINQLDEPQKIELPKVDFKKSQKVKVSQFVADWIEYFKKTGDWDLFQAMDYLFEKKEIREWLEDKNNQETFALAWIFGYEVEEENWYRISMPKARNHKNHAQILCKKDGSIFWCGEWYPFRTKFTRKQLEEANFGWVFDCEGIEIEEVE